MNTWDPKDFFKIYDLKVKTIINLLIQADDEITDVFRFRNEKGEEIISPNVQLILVFTFIDILGNYYQSYLGVENIGHTKKFKEFVDKFCFTDENSSFKDRKYMRDINSDDLKNLRNGLVHFYGIGTQKNIIIASNDSTNDAISDAINNHSIDKNPIVIVPSELQDIARDAGQLFTKNFNIDYHTTNEEKIEKMSALDRILEKINREGTILLK